MGYEKVIAEIDAQIERLQDARTALQGLGSASKGGGRRKMSASARKRIAAAQRKRWAKWKAKHKR